MIKIQEMQQSMGEIESHPRRKKAKPPRFGSKSKVLLDTILENVGEDLNWSFSNRKFFQEIDMQIQIDKMNYFQKNNSLIKSSILLVK